MWAESPEPADAKRCGEIGEPLMHVEIGLLVPLPVLETSPTGRGPGLAVCPTLGLAVTSCTASNTLHVFALPSTLHRDPGASPGTGLVRVGALGGAASPPPLQFQFDAHRWGLSGYLAFTGPPTSRLLLVTDAGHDAVHVVDVARRQHMGYVAGPGAIGGPRGVAARGSLVAVSAWKSGRTIRVGHPSVHLFEGGGPSWTPLRVLAGGSGRVGPPKMLHLPLGLRFTRDGSGVVVANARSGSVDLFNARDGGGFVRPLATALEQPEDVEECEGGWLVVCTASHSVMAVASGVSGGDGAAGCEQVLGELRGFLDSPSTLGLVPGLGLVVRDDTDGGRLQVFAMPDTVAMASMSPARVAWMVGVARALQRPVVTGVPVGWV